MNTQPTDAAVNPSTPKTQLQPSTGFRKAVLGGSLTLASTGASRAANHAVRAVTLIFTSALLVLPPITAFASPHELSSVAPQENPAIWSGVDCPVFVLSDVAPVAVKGVEVVSVPSLGAYKLTPRRSGRFVLQCGSGASVQLDVPCKLPKPDAGFGFFLSPRRFKYPANEQRYYDQLARDGFNTSTTQADRCDPEDEKLNAGQVTARRVSKMARAGLLDKRWPVVCYSVDAPDVVVANKSREASWPELIVQSIDEPNFGQEATLDARQKEAHQCGLRIGTAIAGYACTGYTQSLPWCAPEDVGKAVPGIGKYLDLWIVLVGTLTESVRDAAAKQGAMLAAYYCHPAGENAALDRWTFGLWAWKARTKMNLIWAYVDKQEGWDYSRVTETPTGPVPRAGYIGLMDGMIDHRVLQAVRDRNTPAGRDWLTELEKRIDLGWWPHGYVKEPKEQASQVPTIDMAKVRAEGMALLR